MQRVLGFILVACLALGAAVTARPARADCTQVEPYLAMERVLGPHLLSHADLSLMDRAALGRSLAQLKQAHARADWTDEDSALLDPPLDAVLSGTAQYVERGFVVNHRGLADDLRRVAWFMVGRCDLDATRIRILLDAEGSVLGAAPFADDAQADPPMTKIALGIGASVVVAAVVVGALFGAKNLRDWSYSYRYNRKSCRIRCDVILGGVRFDGLVTVLGLKGGRIEIATEVDMPMLYRALFKDPPEIGCEDVVIPAKVVALYDRELGILFDEPLSLALQHELLEFSTSAPHYVEPKRLGANFKPVAFDPPRAAYRRVVARGAEETSGDADTDPEGPSMAAV